MADGPDIMLSFFFPIQALKGLVTLILGDHLRTLLIL